MTQRSTERYQDKLARRDCSNHIRDWFGLVICFGTLVIAGSVSVSAATSSLTSDPHLTTVPRSVDEIARIEAVTAPTRDFSKAEAFEELSAGAATVRPRNTRDAFSQPSANISFAGELDFKVGKTAHCRVVRAHRMHG